MNGRTTTLTVTAIAVTVVVSEIVAVMVGGRNGVEPVNRIAGAAAVFAFLAIGIVLGLLRPANRVGWLLLATAACWSGGAALIEAGVYGLRTAPGSVDGAAMLAVAGDAVRAVAWLLAVVVVAAVFPDGRLAGPRWRWLGWLIATAAVLVIVAELTQPTIEERRLAGFPNPIGLPPAFAAVTSLCALAGTALTAVGAVGAIASLVSRWRRGGPILRQQLLAYSIALALPVAVPLGIIWGGPPPWLFDVAVIPLTIAIAVAVLQHRLYDLHLLANRTMLWLALSASIVAVYALVIGGVGGLLASRGAPWLPWVATGVVAVSFAPLRSALQVAANRVTYGRWEQPYDVLADLGRRLEAAADMQRLLDSVAGELADGLGLVTTRITDADGTVLVTRGTVGDGEVCIPLFAYGTRVGTLAYRADDRPPRPGDERLLADLARQLGGVLHARALVAELTATRERLVLAREEERRRLRRDLHDGVGPALAGLILKVDTIANLLPPNADDDRRRLRDLRDDVQATVGDVRRVVEGLRPPALDELGLVAALHQAAARVAGAAGVRLEMDVAGDLDPLPAAVEVSAYRIAVEAVTNVVRHANARTCTVALACQDGTLLVTVTDDGVGLPDPLPHGSGNGLATMRERTRELGGTLEIQATELGTRVCARLPLPAPMPMPAPMQVPA